MEPNFLDAKCDVFMNGSEIRIEEKIEGERFKKYPSFQSKNDDTMQFIIKQLHEQKLKCKPHCRKFPTWVFFGSMMNH
jgi:hypothetical protein